MNEATALSTGAVFAIAAVIALVLLLTLIAWLTRDLYRSLGPTWLYVRGRYGDARKLAAKPFWQKRLFPTVRDSLRYTEASCLHMEGRLEEALELLTALRHDELNANLGYAVDTVEAATLVLLDRDAARAATLMTEAREVMDNAGNMLVHAHAELSLGNGDDAQRLYARATSAEPASAKVGVKIALFYSAEAEGMSDAFFRGWFLHRLGEPEAASADLDRALSSPLDNIYRRRAAQLAGRG